MGGEGIIMRDPDASYMTGYTQVFYKHKVWIMALYYLILFY